MYFRIGGTKLMDLSIFTDKEAVELILGCYTFTLGFWEDELDTIPEAKRFVEMGYTQANEDYKELQEPNKEGYALLHEYIKKFSNDFIDYINKTSLEQKHNDVAKWFSDKLNLDTMEDAEEISEYICGNLYHYGYKLHKCSSRRKGKYYRFEKI